MPAEPGSIRKIEQDSALPSAAMVLLAASRTCAGTWLSTTRESRSRMPVTSSIERRARRAVAVRGWGLGCGGDRREVHALGQARLADPDGPVEVVAILVRDDLEAGGRALSGDRDRPCQEHVPDAIPALAVVRDDLGLVAHPVIVPATKRNTVVLGDVLDTVDLEARALHVVDHGSSRQARVGALKDVLGHEESPHQVFDARTAAQAGPLHVEKALVLEQVVHLTIEGGDVLDANVLHHLEVGDLLEPPGRNVAVIEAEDFGATGHTR